MKARLRVWAARAVTNAGHALYLGVRTFGQTLAGVLAGSGAGLVDADWLGSVSVAGMAGLIAVLMNLTGEPPKAEG